MNKPEVTTILIDRYLRNELEPDEEAAFETALLESPDLQQQLETAMAVRQTVLLADELGITERTTSPPTFDARNRWQLAALAASVVLAAFSTTMYWKVSNDAGMLRSEIEALSRPLTTVITIPVDIMRSASTQTPDVIIQKPDGNALLALSVELSPAVTALGQVRMAFRDMQGAQLIAWDSGSLESGRATAAFPARNLPTGKVWLETSDGQGQILDRRLIEFLPPQHR